MPVTTKHPDYDKYVDRWATVRDCISGSIAVKRKKKQYLPKPNENDISEVNDLRYRQYINRAIFTNFCARTLNAHLGAVFRKQPASELPAGFEEFIYDVNGNGLSLEQFSKEIISDVIQSGRSGILVDFPKNLEGISREEELRMNIRPIMLQYKPESIINWREEQIGGKNKVVLVVLHETYKDIDPEDYFECEIKDQYRELILIDGVYNQRLWREVRINDTTSEWIVIEQSMPIDGFGSTFDYIPFFFIGSTNNDPNPDDSALYDMAVLNIGHYRNSADVEESSFLTGQPTLFFTSTHNATEMKAANPQGITLGSRTGYHLGETGYVSLVQAAANPLPRELMKDKEEQLIMIGARIISDTSGVETAEAVRIKFSSENSMLATIVDNASESIEYALEVVGRFLGITGTYSYELNRDFYDKALTPEEISAQILLLDRGIIANSDVRARLRETGYLEEDREDDDIDEEVSNQAPVMVGPSDVLDGLDNRLK